ncbi:MAG: DUF2336 domain-containing protein [Alphaproteobacteria bacterium]|nr:DUF2336 domain-containing protein [Alphaproteobacteria bacterium SS10]
MSETKSTIDPTLKQKAAQLRPDELPMTMQPDLVEAILRHGRQETMAAMASRSDLPPVMVHEIAKHKSPPIRLAVAKNKSADTKTLITLAEDKEAKIRTATVPGLVGRLSGDAGNRPLAQDKKIIDALAVLAEDELAVVRRALSAEIMGQSKPVGEVVNILAQDLDRAVAEPILTSAPNVDEKLLKQVVEHYPPPWVLKAIAQRKQLGAGLTQDIVEHRDAETAGLILDNDGAVINDASFAVMVDMAETHQELQEPLAVHPALLRDEAMRLAYVAGERILIMLQEAKKIDPKTAKRLAKEAAAGLAKARRHATYADAVGEAKRLHEQGALTDDWLREQLDPDDWTAMIGALAYRSQVHPLVVKRILQSDSAKAVTALTWRADFAMATAEAICGRAIGMDAKRRLAPARDGSYPMRPEEMTWYLEFFGIGNSANAV